MTPLEQAAVMVAVVAGVLFIGHAIRSFGDILAEVALQVGWAFEGLLCKALAASSYHCALYDAMFPCLHLIAV